ncbi:MAG: hypothetical protein Q9168_006610 [Polycauliona sp. 1 TL-2023]
MSVAMENAFGTVSITSSTQWHTDSVMMQRRKTVIHFSTSWWLAGRTLLASITRNAYGIGITLSVGRVIDDESAIVRAVWRGDVQTARSLFVNGLASPRDVTGHNSGRLPLLNYAVMSGNLEICRLLIDAGADLQATDVVGWNGLERLLQYRPNWPKDASTWVDALRLFVEHGKFDPHESKLLTGNSSYPGLWEDLDPHEQLAERTPLETYKGELEGFQYLLDYPMSIDDLALSEDLTDRLLRGLCREETDDRCLGYWLQLGGDLPSRANKKLMLIHQILAPHRTNTWREWYFKPMYGISARAKLLINAGFDLHERDSQDLTAFGHAARSFEYHIALAPWRNHLYDFIPRDDSDFDYALHPADRRTAYLLEQTRNFNSKIKAWLDAMCQCDIDVAHYIEQEKALFQGSLVLVDDIEDSRSEVIQDWPGVRGQFQPIESELHLIFDTDSLSIRYERRTSSPSIGFKDTGPQIPQLSASTSKTESSNTTWSFYGYIWQTYFVPLLSWRLKFAGSKVDSDSTNAPSSLTLINLSFLIERWNSNKLPVPGVSEPFRGMKLGHIFNTKTLWVAVLAILLMQILQYLKD